MASPNTASNGDSANFIDQHVRTLRPLERESGVAYWEMATTGSPGAAERRARAQTELTRLYAHKADAERVRGWLDDGQAADALERRQLVVLDLEYRGSQLPDDVIQDLNRRESELQQIFTTFRATLDGEPVTDNDLRDVLRTERDIDRRRRAWEASKEVGARVAEPLRELVRRRNDAAQALGYGNYYQMGLALKEHDEHALFGLLDEFAARSDEPFRKLHGEVEQRLAERYGIETAEVRPWHWEDFFSGEAPATGRVELNPFFRDVDAEALARRFFAGIGLPIDDVLGRSDLYEREGKNQHAFCINIDREGDVRTLCNLRPDEHWTMVLLHELGHGVYDHYLPKTLPYLLRVPAHILSTESIAMYMGRLTRDPAWLRDMLGVELDAEAARDVREQLRMRMLISTRWMLVMAHFERELYRDPDREDLTTLWWDLVERFQFTRRPEEREGTDDWAAKIHLSVSPVYYHNYLMGELMASQLTAYIDREIRPGAEGSIVGDERVGRFLREEIFARGAILHWNDLLVEATGEGLNPKFFVEQFVDG